MAENENLSPLQELDSTAIKLVVQGTLEDEARTELAMNNVIAPEDLLADIGPLGQLLYLNHLAWHVMTGMTGMLSDSASSDLEQDAPPVIALQELTTAVGMLNQVCVTIGILPDAAQLPE